MHRRSRTRRRPRALRAGLRTAALATLAITGITGITGCAGGAEVAPVGEITVAVASNLRPAFEEIGNQYTARTGIDVVFSFSSSGRLKEQIVNGAPFDVFLSADPAYVDQVIAAGRGDATTRHEFAWGALALWTPPGVEPPRSLAEVGDARFRRIALANPAYAPYGTAAMEALASTGLTETVTDRLVYGQSVADAFRIAQSGDADLGIVATSLALADGGTFVSVPAEAHAPVRHDLVVTATGQRADAAREFARFVGGETAMGVLTDYGFSPPPTGQDAR